MNEPKTRLIDVIADRVDLAIDFLTLGQYGLEGLEGKASAGDAGCEGGASGHCAEGLREALPPARRRGCERLGRPAAQAA